MQTHKKLKARILSLALSAAMVTTMMPTTVFATEGGNIAPGASSVGEIQSFDKLDSRFDPSTGKDAPSHVYGLAVELDTPEEDLNLPTELTAMVARTTVSTPSDAEDEPVVDSGKVDEPAEDETIPDADTTIPDEGEVTGEDADDTVSGNQPATPSDATEDVTEEIKNEDVPLAPEPKLEQEQDEETVTTVEQETIPVTWNSDKEYVSDENGQFVYTAEISEDYILADGVELPQIYVSVGRQARTIAEGDVASIGETGYDTLQAAFTAVTDGQTITLLNGISLATGQGVTLNKSGASVKLDLAGKTIAYSGGGYAITLTAGSLEIMDSGTGGAVSATAPSGSVIYNNGTGAVTVSGGTVSAIGGEPIYNYSTGTVTISGGTVSATGNGTAIYNKSTGLITISQGEGKTTLVTSANTSTTQGTIYLYAGAATDTVLTITGGTVSNTASPDEGYSVYNSASGIMNISEDATVGRVYPEQSTSVAKIGDQGYDTLQAAFVAAQTGETVEVLQNCEYTVGDAPDCTGAVVIENKSVTLDLKTYTVKASLGEIGDTDYPAYAFLLKDSATLTVKGEETGTLDVSNSNTYTHTPGTAIYVPEAGKIIVRSGNIITSGGSACHNSAADGEIEISGGKISSTANPNAWPLISTESTGSKIIMTGGTITTAVETAIKASGTLTVSGGKVETTYPAGYAISGEYGKKITISGTAEIKSASAASKVAGTIFIWAVPNSPETVLEIKDTAKVTNSATPEGYSVYFKPTKVTAANLSSYYSAAEGTTVGRIYPETAVAEIAGTKYTTLQEAFTAVADGETIKILENIDLGNKIVTLNKADASVKLDLNGKTITYSETGNAILIYAGSLEIKDSGASGTISATADKGYAIYNNGTGTVTVSGGTVSATGVEGRAIYNATGTVTVSDGTVSATADLGVAIYNAGIGSVIVSGGTVNATTGWAIINYSTGTVTVSGGTVSVIDGVAIANGDSGTVTVSGGTVNATTGRAISNAGTGTVTVSGGTVNATTGRAISNAGTGSVTVSGGTVSATTGRAIHNNNTGHITISQVAGKTTLVTSANTNADQGTIYLSKVPATDPKTVLDVQGGTVKNTATPEGYSVYFKDTAVTVANLANYYTKAGGATVGRVYPEPPTAAPSATVADVTVNGTVGELINGNNSPRVIITLQNDKIKGFISSQYTNIDNWFTSLPAGIKTYAVAKENNTKVQFYFGGTPTAPFSEVFAITIPGDKLTSGNPLTVTANPNAKFNIVSGNSPTPPSGGGSSSGSGGGGSSTIWTSTPPSYTGGTKIIGNVRVPDYTVEGNWKKNTNGTWTFAENGGKTYVNTWAPVYNPYANVIKGQSAFDWFKFDANGNMMTGWHTDVDGNTYYLNPTSDNTLGAMKTGWVLIDGKYYYFNEKPDGTRGKLFKSTRTPDGYLVDENGIWNGSDKQL